MEAAPLKKEIYEKAKSLGITDILLRFSGGNDEGFLDIELSPYKINEDYTDLTTEIEDWAWDVYSYSGAGDGRDYGDNINYNLKEGTTSTQEWFTTFSEGSNQTDKLYVG
jgi:hypothetical protein